MDSKHNMHAPPQYGSGYPHPPQPGFVQPPQIMHQQPVIVAQPAQIMQRNQLNVGPDPQQVVCPSCHATILTNVNHEPTTKTHLAALCLCCCICWPCVCLPYCMDSCQNTNHYCPNCNAFIGTYAS